MNDYILHCNFDKKRVNERVFSYSYEKVCKSTFQAKNSVFFPNIFFYMEVFHHCIEKMVNNKSGTYILNLFFPQKYLMIWLMVKPLKKSSWNGRFEVIGVGWVEMRSTSKPNGFIWKVWNMCLKIVVSYQFERNTMDKKIVKKWWYQSTNRTSDTKVLCYKNPLKIFWAQI